MFSYPALSHHPTLSLPISLLHNHSRSQKKAFPFPNPFLAFPTFSSKNRKLSIIEEVSVWAGKWVRNMEGGDTEQRQVVEV